MGGLDAGLLDREVTIQQLTEEEGESGFPVETWEELDTVWMHKMSSTQGERFQAAQLSAPIVTRWRMYWRDDMDPDAVDVTKKRRLLYQGRYYDITGAEEVGRQDGIELMTLAAGRV